MNIAVVGSSKRFFSGLSAYTISLANALSKENIVCALLLRNLAPRFLYPGRHRIGKTGCSLDFLPQIQVLDGMDWNSPVSWMRSCRFLRQQKSDVIIMHWWTASVAHMLLLIALVNRVVLKAKMIIEMHEVLGPFEESVLPLRVYSRIMGRLLMGRADAFIVHADTVRDQATRVFGLDRKKVIVIPLALFDEYHRDLDSQEARDKLGISERFVILHFGMIKKYKGVPGLVEAFDRLPPDIARGSRLLIVGEDWGEEPLLNEMVASASYKEQITYIPQFVPDEMVPLYFCAADVVVLPYVRTSGSAVAAIAVAYGKPVIASDTETMREVRSGYPRAWFFPVGDCVALRGKIAEVYRSYQTPHPSVCNQGQSTSEQTAQRYQEFICELSRKDLE